ncbi:hypothetical protein Bhyg_00893 [Pseudolycoriella hygida]|uniref:Uncharacterized protein n=1 Tax=Pseudolycoriella hygida TaxID=35572 RepID=A0A9Q0S706_9DIPT|nr:hypothetical protein Bhyg_00893 [Pseudolycoriella hygida]
MNNRNADGYQRISAGHRLYQTLLDMYPTRLIGGKSYICTNCLQSLDQHLNNELGQISIQPDIDDMSLTTTAGQSTIETNIVQHQPTVLRPLNEEENASRSRPGPASRKQKSMENRNTTDKTSSQESVVENEFLLNVGSQSSSHNSQEVNNPSNEPTATTQIAEKDKQRVLQEPSSRRYKPGPASKTRKNHSSSSSNSRDTTSSQGEDLLFHAQINSDDSSENMPPKTADKLQQRQISKTVPSKRISSNENNSKTKRFKSGGGRTNSENQIGNVNPPTRTIPTPTSNSDEQNESVATAAAPPNRNPRIREENTRLPDIMRRFFAEGTRGPTVNVGNYSRTLAG